MILVSDQRSVKRCPLKVSRRLQDAASKSGDFEELENMLVGRRNIGKALQRGVVPVPFYNDAEGSDTTGAEFCNKAGTKNKKVIGPKLLSPNDAMSN